MVAHDPSSPTGAFFVADFWVSLCALLNIKISLSSGNHPQTNGMAEATNKNIEPLLRLLTSSTHEDWFDILPIAEFSYNSTPKRSIGNLSPFQVVYGKNPASIFLLSPTRWFLHLVPSPTNGLKSIYLLKNISLLLVTKWQSKPTNQELLFPLFLLTIWSTSQQKISITFVLNLIKNSSARLKLLKLYPL